MLNDKTKPIEQTRMDALDQATRNAEVRDQLNTIKIKLNAGSIDQDAINDALEKLDMLVTKVAAAPPVTTPEKPAPVNLNPFATSPPPVQPAPQFHPAS
jgi:hypothetical protein